MKKINDALKAKNVKLKELPKDVQDDITALKQMMFQYNLAVEEYEDSTDEDKDVEAKLDAMTVEIDAIEAGIAERITAFEVAPPPPVKTPEEIAVEEAQAAAEAAALAAEAAKTKPPVKKEEDTSIGWLVFGGAVLLVTLGAVNVFKKK
jgi:hypothetical protein